MKIFPVSIYFSVSVKSSSVMMRNVIPRAEQESSSAKLD